MFRTRFIHLLLLGTACAAAACNVASTDASATASGASTYTITFDSGTADSAVSQVASVVPLRLHVTLAGVAVIGAPVTWTVTTGHGYVTAASTATDSLGATSVQWVLGDTVGLNTLAVVSLDASSTLRRVGVAGPASALRRLTADSSGVVAGGSLVIGVRAVDFLGNAVSGASVQWAASSGELSATTTVSGASGDAVTTLRTVAGTATYLVTATLPDHAEVTFKVVTF